MLCYIHERDMPTTLTGCHKGSIYTRIYVQHFTPNFVSVSPTILASKHYPSD